MTLPERLFHADLTPIELLRAALCRTDRRRGPIPPGSLPAMRGQTSSDRPWLLLPHSGGRCLGRHHSGSSLPVQLLQKDNLSASELRVSVAPLQCFGDRAVPCRPPAHRTDPAGGGPSCRVSDHALPARAVLDSPFPKASACSEPGTGGAGSPAGRGGLCIQSPADARIDWMDRRPSLPVFATARASAGLARASGSVRVTNHAARGLPDLSRSPT